MQPFAVTSKAEKTMTKLDIITSAINGTEITINSSEYLENEVID